MIFFVIYIPITFMSRLLEQALLLRIDLYGLYFVAAICGLSKIEAVLATVFLGLWLDGVQPDIRLFGLQAILLSALTYACWKQSWRVVVESYARIFAVCAQCFLQIFNLLFVFSIYQIPIRYLKFYTSSFLVSICLVAILTQPLLRLQNKYFVE
jgi:hypothetical protein